MPLHTPVMFVQAHKYFLLKILFLPNEPNIFFSNQVPHAFASHMESLWTVTHIWSSSPMLEYGFHPACSEIPDES